MPQDTTNKYKYKVNITIMMVLYLGKVLMFVMIANCSLKRDIFMKPVLSSL